MCGWDYSWVSSYAVYACYCTVVLTEGGEQALSLVSEDEAEKEPVKLLSSAMSLACSRNPRNVVPLPDNVTAMINLHCIYSIYSFMQL